MTTTTTPEAIAAIIAALSKIHVRPFERKSCDTKRNAQQNLDGKTHYVDEDTLRWHKSRVLEARALHGGLLFEVVASDAMDMHNTKRGFRVVTFDLFGTTIDRPKLDEATATKAAAIKRSDGQTIDLVAHYQAAIAHELRNREREAAELREALATLPAMEAQAA